VALTDVKNLDGKLTEAHGDGSATPMAKEKREQKKLLGFWPLGATVVV
jgi:hypothetical protein